MFITAKSQKKGFAARAEAVSKPGSQLVEVKYKRERGSAISKLLFLLE